MAADKGVPGRRRDFVRNSYDFPMGLAGASSVIPMGFGGILPVREREHSHAGLSLPWHRARRICRLHGLRGLLCADLNAMTFELVLAGGVTVGLLAYVAAVLLHPERF
ncbi:hypothetical protein AA0522_1431 [Gluconacetobacter liquefaciens NRIC 0522]|nr:hypothetical protein AA0522_1431 [Gluconacetobacter liquefaciens NRIC 0522]